MEKHEIVGVTFGSVQTPDFVMVRGTRGINDDKWKGGKQ